MRPLVILAAALPLALGCARQSAVHHSTFQTDGPLEVQLFPLSADRQSLDYVLSEPAYVAIFAVTRGQGVSLVFPYSPTQVDRPSRRGINQAWPRRATGGVYYIIASRYPLPVEGIVQSKSLLRQLVGEDAFRGAKLTETWSALKNIMVPELPDEAWSSSLNTYRSAGYATLYDPLRAGRQAFFSQLSSYGRSYR